MEFLRDEKHEDTAMAEAFEEAGLKMPERDETPQEAAERIWEASKRRVVDGRGSGRLVGDPVETMRMFDAWARENPERIISILNAADARIWNRCMRAFLERRKHVRGGWRFGFAFYKAMRRKEMKFDSDDVCAREVRRKKNWRGEDFVRDRRLQKAAWRKSRERKAAGLKIVRAEVDVTTGAVVNLIDKEYGPFGHIRINGLKLPEVTTEDALKYCDRASTDVRFIRALCQMIPDPRKPIGEQWDADMIREAKRIATSSEAA